MKNTPENPWGQLPEIAPQILPTHEVAEHKPSIADIEGALEILRREEEGGSDEEEREPTIQ